MIKDTLLDFLIQQTTSKADKVLYLMLGNENKVNNKIAKRNGIKHLRQNIKTLRSRGLRIANTGKKEYTLYVL